MIMTSTFQGEFKQDQVALLLQYLAQLGSTGEFVLESEGRRASVSFEHGKILDAQFGKINGQEALFRALKLESGKFIFYRDQPRSQTTISASIESLLMDGANWLDSQAQPIPAINWQMIAVARTPNGAESIRLETTHWQIVTQVNGQLSLAQIAQKLGRTPSEIEPAIRDLLRAGVIGLESSKHQALDPAFLSEVSTALEQIVGPMAKVLMNEAAKDLGESLETINVQQIEHFLETLARNLPTRTQAAFRGLIEPLVRRFGFPSTGGNK